MRQAKRVNSTPSADPSFAAIENYRKLDKASSALAAALRDAEREAAKKHGSCPLPLVYWRNHHIGKSEIERVHDELLSLPGIDPKTIENEYWDVQARLMGTELARKEWDKRAGLTALRRDYDRADAASERAAWKLARTKSTTTAGASAFLSYISTEPAVGLFDLGETDWHETAFRTVVAALAKITGQSHRVA